MLRRAVQQRPYDWESLLAPVLQSYRSTVSEATGFTPDRLAFGRKRRLLVDLGTPLPTPPRNVSTVVAELADDFEWSYKVAREIIGQGHKRAENRFNERVVKRAYHPDSLVRVLLNARNCNVLSKLNMQYLGLYEVTEVRGPLLTLRELDKQRIFTANYDSARSSTIARFAPLYLPRALPRSRKYCMQCLNLQLRRLRNQRCTHQLPRQSLKQRYRNSPFEAFNSIECLWHLETAHALSLI